MGRIIGYQYDDNVQDGDAWIGSEDGGGRTKQYTAEAVANYLNIQGKISIVGQMTYKYVVTPESETGSFAIFGGGPDPVAFSAVTKLTLSNTDVSGQRVVEFLNLLVGSDILISKQSAISTFGYYSIDNYAVNATDPAYYDLGVTFKSGNGSMEADKVYETQNFTLAAEENISTLQTTIDSGNTYQASPSDPLWTWGSGEITTTSTSFKSLLSSKRFKTTLIADGSYTDVLPNTINFYNSLGSLTTLISSSTAVAAAINLELPSSSGTLALTTDITASPWDTVTGGINYANGNVGIGTTTPSEKLDVVGNIKLRGTNNLTIGSTSSGGNFSLSSGIRGFNFANNNGDLVRIDSAGNVGIGTTSPSSKLHIEDSMSNGSVFKITTSTSGTLQPVFDARISSNGDGFFDFNTYKSATKKIQIKSANTSYIQQVDGSGGFDIKGHLKTSLQTVNGGGVLQLHRYGALSLNNDASYAHTPASALYINTLYNTSTDYLMLLANQGSDKLAVDLNGNVGIGTTSPSEKLEVSGNIRGEAVFIKNTGGYNAKLLSDSLTTNKTFQFPDADGTIALTSDIPAASQWDDVTGGINYANGNVGIGTTSPGEKLEVSGYIKSSVGFKANTYTSLLESSNDTVISNSAYYNMLFKTNNAERMRITNGGNVGIGTTNPSEKLEVAGDMNLYNPSATSQINFRNIGGANYIKSNGYSTHFGLRGNTGNGVFIIEDSFATTQDIRIKPTTSGWDFSSRGVAGANALLTIDSVLNISNKTNVGIGTTSPGVALEVQQSADNQGLKIVGFDNENNSNLHFYVDNFGNDRITSSEFLNITSGGSSSYTAAGYLRLRGVGATSQVELDGSTIKFTVTSSEKMRLTSTGLGIGTTSPSQELHVDGNARVTRAYYDSNNSPGTAGQVLSSTGAQTSWVDPSAAITKLIPYFQIATPGGSDTYTQSNNIVDFDWSGGSGTYEYILPSATAIPYRKIRFVNNSTISASNKIHITAPGTETIDGGSFYEIRKPYNGCAVWSDGVQWIVIQAKA